MEYLSYKVEQAEFRLNTPARKALKKHLLLVAEALHKIEWNDSGDGADGEEWAIRAVLNKNDVLSACIEEAEKVLRDLIGEMEAAKNVDKK